MPPFTLVGATTRSGLITNPLRERFGIPLRLEFLRRLRDERAFENPDALRLQIKRDVARVRDYFRRLRPRRRTLVRRRRAHG